MNEPRANRLLSLLVLALCLFSPISAPASEKENVPAPAARVLNEAFALLEKNQPDKAAKLLADFLEKGQDHHLIRFALGNCHMSAHRAEKARDQYLAAIRLSPQYGPAWFNLANSYYELKHYEKAGKTYVIAYDRSTDQKAEALYFAAASFLAADRPAEALSAFDRLLQAHREKLRPEWQVTYAHILLALKQFDRALPVIRELSEKSTGPQKKQWQEILLYHYISLKMNREALIYAEALSREDPLDPGWWKGMVHLNLLENRHREALAPMIVYSHLVDLSDEEKKLLADLFAAAHIPARSAGLLEEILSKNRDVRIIEQLARNYQALHRPSVALAWVDKGLKRDKKNKTLLWLKGNLLFAMKAYPEAAGIFAAATRSEDAPAEAWLMLGYAAWHADDLDGAYKAFQKAASFPGKNKAAREALMGLKKQVSGRRPGNSNELTSTPE